MARGRMLLVAGAALALASLLSGCVVFTTGPTAKQIGKKPKVKVKFSVCASGGEGCDDLGNSGAESLGFGRLLVGFRVPKGTKAPDSFAPKSTAGAAGTVPAAVAKVRRDDVYTSELNQEAPKGRKYKWIGYQSDPIEADEGRLEGTFKVKFGLPKDFDKKRFKVRPVVGGYANDSDADAELADCGTSLYEFQFDIPEGWICIDDPSESDVRKSLKVKIKQKNG